MMKILAVVFAVFIFSAQAEDEWDDWDKEETEHDWDKGEGDAEHDMDKGDAEHEWDKDEDTKHDDEWDDHKPDTDDWHNEMYGSGSFNTIFLPLLVTSVVLARLARR